MLNKTIYRYTIDKKNKTKITNLLYMDDKTIRSKQTTTRLLFIKINKDFSNDMKMKFGTDKCKINRILYGKHNKPRPYNLTQQNKFIDSMNLKKKNILHIEKGAQ